MRDSARRWARSLRWGPPPAPDVTSRDDPESPSEVLARLAEIRDDVFGWCGELSAKSGELMARLNELNVMVEHLTIKVEHLEKLSEEARGAHDDERAAHGRLHEMIQAVGQVTTADVEGVPRLRRLLVDARATEEYAAAFDESEPLVTVRIATYNRPELLVERAIASVLEQTYEHFEIVVVGDGCDEETAERLSQLSDPRIRYVNFPHHGVYPDDPVARWRVAGCHAMNLGSELANGTWIAPLDDDNAMDPDHLEVLLAAARESRHEMVYGRLYQHLPEPKVEREIGEYPPKEGQFDVSAALYLAALRFFEHDPLAWMVDQVADWYVCKQMMDCGVRIGFVERAVTTAYVAGPRYGS